MVKQANSGSRIDSEIAQFDAIGGSWWDEQGPFKPLHLINPVRLTYIKNQIAVHYPGIESNKLNLLDIGCGGGLLCEPLVRQGFRVTGLDASPAAIATAQAHAAKGGLDIRYVGGTVEEFNEARGRKQEAGTTLKQKSSRQLPAASFDIITALEIIEHVDNPAAFIVSCAQLLKPNGLIIFSTLNRTVKALLLGKIAAEYILRLVPVGTHSWQKFVKPSELSGYARDAGLTIQNVTGLVFNPAAPDHALFSLSKTDVAVNYFMTAIF